MHPQGETNLGCQNIPTIQGPTQANFDALPVTSSWTGEGYFNEGIWRFIIQSKGSHKLLIDGKPCCAFEKDPDGCCHEKSDERDAEPAQCHAYLAGMHRIEIVLSGRSCATPFQLLAYRIR